MAVRPARRGCAARSAQLLTAHLSPPPQAPPHGDDIVSAAQTMKLFAARPPPPPASAPIRAQAPAPDVVLVTRRRRTQSPSARRATPRRACNDSPFTPHDPAAPKRCVPLRCFAPFSFRSVLDAARLLLTPNRLRSCPAPQQRYGGAGTQRNGACPGEIPALPADAVDVEVVKAPLLRFPPRAVLAAAAGPPGALRPRPGDAPVPVRLLALFRATTWGTVVLRRSATQQQHLASAFAWPGMP